MGRNYYPRPTLLSGGEAHLLSEITAKTKKPLRDYRSGFCLLRAGWGSGVPVTLVCNVSL